MVQTEKKGSALFLSAHLPSPTATQAGQLTAFRNLQLLANDYELHLITFRTNLEKDWSLSPLEKICTSIKIVDLTNFDRITGILSNLHLPLQVATRGKVKFQQEVILSCKQNSFQRVHMEWIQMAQFLPFVSHIKKRSIYAQDSLTQVIQRKIQSRSSIERSILAGQVTRTKTWENKILQGSDFIFVPSIKDWEFFQNIAEGRHLNGGVMPVAFNCFPQRQKLPEGRLRLAYWGSYARSENVDAALTLVDNILPILQKMGLDVEVILAGANPTPELIKRKSSDVIISGFVEKPAEVLWSAHMAIVPLRFGSGVKVKILECLSAGVPVVCTPVGGEGIPCGPEEGLFVTQDYDLNALANIVQSIASNPEKLEALSSAAAQWARRYAVYDASSFVHLGATT
jgi:polysaccharide biosynthesis protein PslH